MSSNSAVNASMLKLAGAAEGDVSHAKAKTPASLKDEAASQIEELSELAGVADGEVSQEKAKTPASLEDQPASQTEEPLELTGATDGKASQAKDETFVSPRDESARRIEKLLEHQNELMLRQIRLAEDNRKHADSMQGILLQNPRTILKALDPSVQGIFKEWHAEFRSKVDVYVKQSQLLNQYQVSAARDGHIAPFSDETKHIWQWPEAYLAHALPIGEDPVEQGGVYDLRAAFGALRQKHAEEAQAFVMSHQEACVKQLSEELSLCVTCDCLVQRAMNWAAMHRSFFQEPLRAEQLLIQQARAFAELVYREELSKADCRIKENSPMMSLKFLLALRFLCVFVIFLGSVTLESEHLARLGAMLFALGCGMALFWEEKFLQSMKAILGGLSPWQLLSQMHSMKAVLGGLGPGQLLSQILQRELTKSMQRELSKSIPAPRRVPAAEEIN